MENETPQATLEEMFATLEEVVVQLEHEDISLEDSFTLYHRGMDILKQCNEKIDTVEKKIKILDEDGKEQDF